MKLNLIRHILLQLSHVRLDPISTFRVISYKQKYHWQQQQSWTQCISVGRRLAERLELWITGRMSWIVKLQHILGTEFYVIYYPLGFTVPIAAFALEPNYPGPQTKLSLCAQVIINTTVRCISYIWKSSNIWWASLC